MLTVVNWGGGVNSTALLCGLREKGLRPDLVIFADTGSERRETYAFLPVLQQWLDRVGFPVLTIVKWWRKRGDRSGQFVPLHTAMLEQKCLPSAAYGYKGCTTKWKTQPIDEYISRIWPAGKKAIARGEKIERLLGIDAGEQGRIKSAPEDSPWVFCYPLAEWVWNRGACKEAIARAGLPLPVKSSCFCCPHMKPSEVRDLRKTDPDLFEIGLQMERQAALRSVVGLGRDWAWESIDSQCELNFNASAPCGCWDGDEDE